MCDCNQYLIRYFEEKHNKKIEDINARRLTDTGKDITEYLEGQCSQMAEIVFILKGLRRKKSDKDL